MAPQLIRGPLLEVRTRVFDNARWAGYQPRADDIVVATYPKSGTTWTCRIVDMLIFASAEPRPIAALWPDMRMLGPAEGMFATATAMTHRRVFKSHLSYDALPVYRGAKFIHVARDGRDAAMSLHNHFINFTAFAVARFNEVNLADPKFGSPYPTTPEDPAEFFHDWVEDGGARGDPHASYFYLEPSYWAARRDPNMLLVHYNDLKKDRAGEMRRIAGFLDITIPDECWPELVDGASFETMKRHGSVLMPAAELIRQTHRIDRPPITPLAIEFTGGLRDTVYVYSIEIEPCAANRCMPKSWRCAPTFTARNIDCSN